MPHTNELVVLSAAVEAMASASSMAAGTRGGNFTEIPEPFARIHPRSHPARRPRLAHDRQRSERDATPTGETGANLGKEDSAMFHHTYMPHLSDIMAHPVINNCCGTLSCGLDTMRIVDSW